MNSDSSRTTRVALQLAGSLGLSRRLPCGTRLIARRVTLATARGAAWGQVWRITVERILRMKDHGLQMSPLAMFDRQNDVELAKFRSYNTLLVFAREDSNLEAVGT